MGMEWLEQGYGLLLMGIFGLAGIIGSISAGNVYRGLLRQSKDMAVIKNRCLNQIKTRYESAYRLGKGEVKAEVIVRKCLAGYRPNRISASGLERINLGAALLCLSAGFFMQAAGSFAGEADSMKFFHTYALFGAASAAIVLFFGQAFSGKSKKEQLLYTLTDYLEHTLSYRLKMEKESRGGTEKKSEINDEAFVKKEETSLEIVKDKPGERLETEEKRMDERQSAEEKKKISERQTAAGIEPSSSRRARNRHLTREEEQLIQDLLQSYLEREK